MSTPSWKMETRGSAVASPLSVVLPRMTQPLVLGDWFWT